MCENNNKNKSEKELTKRIEELEEVIDQMKKERSESELLTFPWVGNLGQWYWMVQSNQVEFNERKIITLGYEMTELPDQIGFDFFTNKLHPEDYDRVMDNMRRHLMGLSDIYEVEYRIRAKSGDYIWYYDRGKVTKRDKDGKPVVVSGIVFDINRNKIMENQLRETNEKLKQMVVTDELTGAYNRRFLLEKIKHEIQRYNRTTLSFSLIMFDIDHFKVINDRFGHNAGDIVLKRLVEVVMKRIRKTDIMCRWGGEEFVILLPDTTAPKAAILAENIRAELSESVIEGVGSITASFGVSCYSQGDTIDTIIKNADDLMYKAKEEGRNCVRY